MQNGAAVHSDRVDTGDLPHMYLCPRSPLRVTVSNFFFEIFFHLINIPNIPKVVFYLIWAVLSYGTYQNSGNALCVHVPARHGGKWHRKETGTATVTVLQRGQVLPALAACGFEKPGTGVCPLTEVTCPHFKGSTPLWAAYHL